VRLDAHGFSTCSIFPKEAPMGVRSAFLFVIVLLIAALAALNWGTLSASTDVWLGFMTVSAPLGLIMLGLTVVLAAFFLVYVLYLHSSVLIDTKRHTKEMQVQRDLADKAEASRFTELRNFLEAQENKHMAQNADRQAAMLARLEQLETAIRLRSDQTDNTVAAHIGQLEDRIERRPVPADINPQA
jgi:Na+-transporting methylmalonyl-CoA/oxaloacetate decarboxylase gamma subunit